MAAAGIPLLRDCLLQYRSAASMTVGPLKLAYWRMFDAINFARKGDPITGAAEVVGILRVQVPP
jgi:hypothetical protein